MAVDWSAWVYTPGLPPTTSLSSVVLPPDFTTTQSDESAQLALDYISGGGDSSPTGFEDYLSFNSNLKVVFHDTLEANYDDVTSAILEKIDADLSVT